MHDGHTELWGAEIVEQSDTTIDDLPLGVEWIGDKLYISHVLADLENEIPLNSEILSINGRTPDDYYRQYMYPYSSGKTLQNRRNRIQMFTGPKGDSVQFVLNRDGKEYPLHLSYNLRQNVDKGNWGTKWLNSYPIKDQLSHWKSQPEKGGFYFLRFDTFGEHLRLSQVMDNAKAEIEESDYVVLDLRFNRGGNEMTADTLLMYFADSDTLKTYKSITRAHNAFNAAKERHISRMPNGYVRNEYKTRREYIAYFATIPYEYQGDGMDDFNLYQRPASNGIGYVAICPGESGNNFYTDDPILVSYLTKKFNKHNG